MRTKFRASSIIDPRTGQNFDIARLQGEVCPPPSSMLKVWNPTRKVAVHFRVFNRQPFQGGPSWLPCAASLRWNCKDPLEWLIWHKVLNEFRFMGGGTFILPIRRVTPCAVKTCAVRPVFARVVGELRAADPSNVQGPVKQNARPRGSI